MKEFSETRAMLLLLAVAMSGCAGAPAVRVDVEAAVQPYLAQAQATYPQAKRRFLAGLPQGDTFFVSVRLRHASGVSEQAFVRVATYEGSTILGRIASDPTPGAGMLAGDAYTCPESDVVDWVILHADGSMEGNVVGDFLDQVGRE